MGAKLLQLLGWLIGVAPALASDDRRRAVCERLNSIGARLAAEGSPLIIRRVLEVSLICCQWLRKCWVSQFRWMFAFSAIGLLACYGAIGFGGIFGAMTNAQPTLPWNVYDRSITAANQHIKNAPAVGALPQFKGTGIIERETYYLNAYVAHYNHNVRIAFSTIYILTVCVAFSVLWKVSLVCSEMVLSDVLKSPRGTSIIFALIGVATLRFLIWFFSLGFFDIVETPEMWPQLYAIFGSMMTKYSGGVLLYGLALLGGSSIGAMLATPDWFLKLFSFFTIPLRLVNWVLVATLLFWALDGILLPLLKLILAKLSKWIAVA
jgi:hypothetical protein